MPMLKRLRASEQLSLPTQTLKIIVLTMNEDAEIAAKPCAPGPPAFTPEKIRRLGTGQSVREVLHGGEIHHTGAGGILGELSAREPLLRGDGRF